MPTPYNEWGNGSIDRSKQRERDRKRSQELDDMKERDRKRKADEKRKKRCLDYRKGLHNDYQLAKAHGEHGAARDIYNDAKKAKECCDKGKEPDCYKTNGPFPQPKPTPRPRPRPVPKPVTSGDESGPSAP